MKILVNILPPDGYRFRDPDGSAFVSTGWGPLIQQVREYRARKGLPTTQVAAEVMEQACARNPQVCSEAGAQQGKRVHVPAATTKSKVIRWLDSIKSPPPRVTAEEAQRRAACCLRCPKNVKVTGGCAACSEVLMALRKRIFPAMPPKVNPDLHACEILGKDLKAAVWMESEVAEVNPELPAHCWKKKTI